MMSVKKLMIIRFCLFAINILLIFGMLVYIFVWYKGRV